MKNNDSLKMKSLKPKKQTIDFLLNFSKNLEVVKIKKNIKDAKLFTYDDISFVNKKSDDIQIR